MPLAFGALRGDAIDEDRIRESGCSNPAIIFISVDLPQPEGPTMATNSPSPTVKLTSSTTCSAPASDAKLLRISVTSILARHSAT